MKQEIRKNAKAKAFNKKNVGEINDFLATKLPLNVIDGGDIVIIVAVNNSKLEVLS